MQLPPALRAAIDSVIQGFEVKDLQRAAETLSARYRTEQAVTVPHLSSNLLAAAYISTRLPATYVAVRSCMQKLREVQPEFAPGTLLDAGSGPGTALLAAADEWDSLRSARLIENSASIRAVGDRLMSVSGVEQVKWETANLSAPFAGDAADLVTCGYVLSELSQAHQASLAQRLWDATAGVLLIVEPGTPAGWQRLLNARRVLVDAAAHLLAPCPHSMPCPLAPPDWCHFAGRVERSKVHRLIKQADVPWEDEKFIYLAASRTPVDRRPAARVLMQPVITNGLIAMKLCNADGTMTNSQVRKRDGEIFKQARRADWGDAI